MFEMIITVPGYENDVVTQTVEKWVRNFFKDEESICYYKYPIVKTNTDIIPDLTVLTRRNQPLIIRCLPYQIEEIRGINDDIWELENDDIIESPLQELDDFVTRLDSKFRDHRKLRGRLYPQALLALPLISESRFREKFGVALQSISTLWKNGDTSSLSSSLAPMLSDMEWQLVRSIIQGATPLNKPSSALPIKVTNLGTAIAELDRQIKLLDREQERAAIKIADGPQLIRGLAGTGKTVLLAMRAAHIHLRYPDKKILFTFNTQSLYKQAGKLISDFYYDFSGGERPNWNMLHIRHAWGGRTRSGVYSDLCDIQGVTPYSYSAARERNPKSPFQFCCERALKLPILPQYDFILVDEAQDFPKAFFRVLWKLLFEPHRICWAYDELQSLSSLEIPKPEELFGRDKNGNPLVSLEGDPYPGGIEKDFVLHRSYRCPYPVLMLAHAIGLGLYSPNGCIQMLGNKSSWESIGYVVESGVFKQDEQIVISRPLENSPNRISSIYDKQSLVVAESFRDREEELDWVAESIHRDITQEGVAPEQIMVISLDMPQSKHYLTGVQSRLLRHNIDSTMPGLIDDTANFAEKMKVTLSTIFRAKGNEAYIVYILSFDSLFDYAEEIENRNRTFTSITRSKAWVRITGTGKYMEDAKKEIDSILSDLPFFKFVFPDMSTIRRLDAETSQRRREVAKTTEMASKMASVDEKASIAALTSLNPEIFEKIVKIVEEAKEVRREN